jgi:hypothetical protein
MVQVIRARGMRALIVSIAVLGVWGVGTAGAVTVAPIARTFSFVGKPGSKTVTLFDIDSLLINARCTTGGSPVIFAFTSANNGDIFGRILDGVGRLHSVHNTIFNKSNKGVLLSTTSSDFDGSGTVLFESSAGKVVTVQYGFDNSTTLGRQNVCTVFGSAIAT